MIWIDYLVFGLPVLFGALVFVLVVFVGIMVQVENLKLPKCGTEEADIDEKRLIATVESFALFQRYRSAKTDQITRVEWTLRTTHQGQTFEGVLEFKGKKPPHKWQAGDQVALTFTKRRPFGIFAPRWKLTGAE